MISLQIAGQAKLFLYGMVAGMVMLLVYDMLRIWRRVVAHGTVWIALEDIVYWCGSAVGLFLLFYQQNDGKIRFFLLLSAFVGMCLYHKGLSPGIVKAGTFVLSSVVKGICFLAKGISRPFVFTVKRFHYGWKKQRHKRERSEKVNSHRQETGNKKPLDKSYRKYERLRKTH